MSDVRATHLQALKQFLRSVQRPGLSVEQVKGDDHLVQVGLVDSLAVVQIAMHLENTYQIDFAREGYSYDRLFTLDTILDLIEDQST